MLNLRTLAIKLLDDDEGITEDAYNYLSAMLDTKDCTEIDNAIRKLEGRVFLKKDHTLKDPKIGVVPASELGDSWAPEDHLK